MTGAGISEESREYPCLLRLTDGSKNKVSTKVSRIQALSTGDM